MLGWVAPVMAMVSPSQPRPAVSQRMSISGSRVAPECPSVGVFVYRYRDLVAGTRGIVAGQRACWPLRNATTAADFTAFFLKSDSYRKLNSASIRFLCVFLILDPMT